MPKLEFKQSATFHSVASIDPENDLIKNLLGGGYKLGSVLETGLRRLYPNITVVSEGMEEDTYNIYFESPGKEIKKRDIEKVIEEEILNMKKLFGPSYSERLSILTQQERTEYLALKKEELELRGKKDTDFVMRPWLKDDPLKIPVNVPEYREYIRSKIKKFEEIMNEKVK